MDFKAITILMVVVAVHMGITEGYGHRYSYNPLTGESTLWTHFPGENEPVELRTNFLKSNPRLWRYRGADGKLRWKCKSQAYYSQALDNCLWRPGYYTRRGERVFEKQLN